MPRRIISQDPVIEASVPAKNLDSMLMTSFRSKTDESGITRVMVMLTPQDNTSKEFGGEPYVINIKDFDQQMSRSPKLQDAWNTINDIMGLAYDFFRLRDKVKEGQIKDQDVSALITQRDAALSSLRAPLP